MLRDAFMTDNDGGYRVYDLVYETFPFATFFISPPCTLL